MAAQSTFLDKLLPETRLFIYSHVFGNSLVIKPLHSFTALGMTKHTPEDTVYLQETFAPIEQNILATSKFIYREALPILYKDKIIRGTTHDFRHLSVDPESTQLVRHIEIADCLITYLDPDFHSIICRLQSLPKIRSITILSDCLCFQLGNGSTCTVPQFCEQAGLGEATCVDIGRYQLHGKYSGVRIAHRRLTQMCPSVKETPENYDPFEELEFIRDRWPSRGNTRNLIPWYLQMSLRYWVGLFEEVRKFEPDHDLEPNDDSINGSFQLEEVRTAIIVGFVASVMMWRPGVDDFDLASEVEAAIIINVTLRLSPEHDHRTLSRCTEFLSLDITAYVCSAERDGDDPPQQRLQRASWAETDGYMPTIEFMLMHQDIARAGLLDAYYIANPVRSDVIHATQAAEFWTHGYNNLFRASCLALLLAGSSILEDWRRHSL
jgi:hypothetical protein